MSNPFEPNKRGLVVVKLKRHYASNVAGETAGFLPAIAKELVKKGYAELPGQPAKAEQPADGGAGSEITTRKFQPQRDPFDHDADGKKGGSLPADQRDVCDKLRAEYKEITGKDADARWGEARLDAEVKRALEAATAPDAAAEQPADGGEKPNDGA